ncbi:MAG TPA: PAS domain-containing protein [Verrucomicrobiae bacterium]|nr:PAS domain-containing protein [Verrucomicrobiae bacterium]
MKTKPYLSLYEVLAVALLVATPLQAQSLADSYSDAVGVGAMGGIIVLLLTWAHAVRRQVRRVLPTGSATTATATKEVVTKGRPKVPPQSEPESCWANEQECLRALLEHSSDFIYFKDRESRFRLCSKAVYERFGVTQEDIIGKTDFDFFDDSHARPAFEDEQEILRTGLAFHGKVERELLNNGTEQWALTAKMPLRNKAGEIIGTFGISKDITDLKRTETQCAYERDLLTTLLDNTADLIYFKDLQSRFVRVSRAKVEWALALARNNYQTSSEANGTGSTPSHLAGLTEFARYLVGKTDFDIYPEERARAAFEDEQEIIRTGLPLVGKLEKTVFPDGKVSWLVTNKMPWRDRDGAIIGTSGISKDITFIKEAEAKLEKSHKQLMEASRLAGMAEVATTVLHNVGNVLNSVNISASVVAEKVKNSKPANLARVADMLREHADDLAAFFATDPKGSNLPAYFQTLAECLATDQKEMLAELTSLCANIEHIKEIVAMQQAYARVAGLRESLQATDLIEDALRLNAGAVERHHVQVIREYAPIPPILVDKHKVLQILVNLIRNAKYALDEHGPADRKMTLRAAPGENGTVQLSVIDNGAGIASENLTRIFGHGFTTRKNGHGFALHSGALAAREMGGTLTCHSAGMGQGATFTLELPLRPPEVNS